MSRFEVNAYFNQYSKQHRIRRDNDYHFSVNRFIEQVPETQKEYLYTDDYAIAIVRRPFVSSHRPCKGMTVSENAFLRKLYGVVILQSADSIRYIHYHDQSMFEKEAKEFREYAYSQPSYKSILAKSNASRSR